MNVLFFTMNLQGIEGRPREKRGCICELRVFIVAGSREQTSYGETLDDDNSVSIGGM